MEAKSKIYIFMDEEVNPLAIVTTPIHIDIDTRKLVDGKHSLKLVSKDPSGKEGIRIIPFEVRNGPAIAVEGIQENAVVDGVVPIMINAYGKGYQKSFLISGSETPQTIPFWVWILLIGFIAWSLYYLVRYMNLPVVEVL
ncbi:MULTISPECIES: cytochrome C [Sphingobacterium]|uniref:cytochrome C n=1 Tax=Sphingobacterium TaxID=28453 RepID=UPI0013DC2E4D|nr:MULTISPECIES: cytochrome C [unclassified Sphingobacterium]